MRWWRSNLGQWQVQNQALSLMLTLFFYLYAPPVPTMFWIICSPTPGPISYWPPILHLPTSLLSIFAPVSIPHLSLSPSNRPPGRRPCPPSATARLRLPPLPASPKEFLTRACDWLPPSSHTPLPPSTCVHVPVGPRVLPSGTPFLPLPVLNLTPSPPDVLYHRPSPLPFLSGGVVFLFPVPYASDSSSLIYSSSSLGVFWSLDSLSGVLLRYGKRPWRLQSLAIARQAPRPSAT